MSSLIKWKLEKLLKRRDFGEITQKQTVKNRKKIRDTAKHPSVTERRRVWVFRVIICYIYK